MAKDVKSENDDKEASKEKALSEDRIMAEMDDAWWNSVGFAVAVVIAGSVMGKISLSILGDTFTNATGVNVTLPYIGLVFFGAITVCSVYLTWKDAQRYRMWKEKLGTSKKRGFSTERIKVEMKEAWWNAYGYAAIAGISWIIAMKFTLPQIIYFGEFMIVAPGDFIWVVIIFFWCMTLGAGYGWHWYDKEYKTWKALL